MTRQDPSVEHLVDEYLAHGIDRRQFVKRAAALGVSLSSATALLAACGGDDEDEAAAPQPPTGPEATTQATTAEDAGEPVRGGTLREGYDRDVSRADPVNTGWWDPHLYPVFHETLIATDPEGNFVPMLAESWETSDDGLVWTFKIRDNLSFQSGAPCDAGAVMSCLNTFRDPAQGINAGFWAPVTKVATGEGNVVIVTMSHPYADFPFVLNNGYSAIFNKASRDELGDDYGVKAADGTGPFTLSEFVPGSHVLATRREDYPGSGTPFLENAGPPYIDAIRWVVLTEPATRAQEIEAGNVDTLRGPAPQDVERLRGNDQLAIMEFQEPAQYLLGLNFKKAELGFDDVRVRQALTHAIDRESIAETVFFGLAVPSYAIVQPAWPYYDDGVEPLGAFDPDMSKALLDQAGWVEGSGGIREKNDKKFSFELVIEADKTEQLVVQAVQQMFRDVGVDMKFKSYGADYFEKFLAGPDGYVIKSLWTNLFDASLLFFSSKYFAPACCNASFTKIPELDAAFDEWQNAANEDELRSAASKALLTAAEQVATIPIVTPIVVWVQSKKVHGWLPSEPNLYPYYNDVWIEA